MCTSLLQLRGHQLGHDSHEDRVDGCGGSGWGPVVAEVFIAKAREEFGAISATGVTTASGAVGATALVLGNACSRACMVVGKICMENTNVI